MAQQTRAVNKALFEDGDKPSGSNYADLIDSFISLADTTTQSTTSDISAPKMIATTEVSSPLIVTTEVSASIINSHQATFTGTVTASAIHVPIMQGPTQIRDSANAATAGRIVLMQQATVAGDGYTQIATLPDGADVIDSKFFIKTPFATAATKINIIIGTSAAKDIYGTHVNATAPGMYSLSAFTSSPTDWDGVSGTGAVVHAKATATSGAVDDDGVGICTIMYVQK